MLGGDFNVVLNPELEKSNYNIKNLDSKNFRPALLSLLEIFNLEDVIRNIVPGKKYIW